MYALGGPDDIAYGNVSFSWWMRERGEIAGHDELTILELLGRARLRCSSR
jgi:hypothetical protein